MSLKEIAKSNTSLSDLMVGRQKGNLEDMCNKVLTIDEVDTIKLYNTRTGNSDTIAVINFVEDSKNFYFGGIVWLNIINDWLTSCMGDILEVNKLLADEQIKVKMSREKTKNGNNITKVVIVDDENDNNINSEEIPY